MTKIDIVPIDKIKKNIKKIKQLLSRVNKKILLIKQSNDLNTIDFQTWIPVIPVSATKGIGLDLIVHSFNTIKPISKQIPPTFIVQNIFNVKGYGLVVSGITGINLHKGQEVFIGPL